MRGAKGEGACQLLYTKIWCLKLMRDRTQLKLISKENIYSITFTFFIMFLNVGDHVNEQKCGVTENSVRGKGESVGKKMPY